MQTENKNQRIAVTGATGRVGSHLVEILAQRGHDVVPIARSKGVDVVSGEGLDEALVGVETIIDAATGPSPDRERAFEQRLLLRHLRRVVAAVELVDADDRDNDDPLRPGGGPGSLQVPR